MALGAVTLRLVHRIAMASALWVSGCASMHGENVPAGWERDDYIAYLALSDFLRLPDIHSQPSKAFVACVVNGMGRPPSRYEDLPDPSPQLLSALIAEFASGPNKRTIRPGSACHEVPAEGVQERDTGHWAIFVSVEAVPPEMFGCGTHKASLHHAMLWGQSAFYEVNLERTPPEAVRSELCFEAE